MWPTTLSHIETLWEQFPHVSKGRHYKKNLELPSETFKQKVLCILKQVPADLNISYTQTQQITIKDI